MANSGDGTGCRRDRTREPSARTRRRGVGVNRKHNVVRRAAVNGGRYPSEDVAGSMDRKKAFRSFSDAIRSGDLERLAQLADSFPEHLQMTTPFGTWLHIAASAGQLAVVAYLLGRGFDVDVRGGVSDGTPLHEAALEGHLDVVKYLHENGSQFDTDDPTRNPLFAAVFAGHSGLVEYLVENGIDKTIRYTGETMVDMDAAAFARERGQSCLLPLLE